MKIINDLNNIIKECNAILEEELVETPYEIKFIKVEPVRPIVGIGSTTTLTGTVAVSGTTIIARGLTDVERDFQRQLEDIGIIGRNNIQSLVTTTQDLHRIVEEVLVGMRNMNNGNRITDYTNDLSQYQIFEGNIRATFIIYRGRLLPSGHVITYDTEGYTDAAGIELLVSRRINTLLT